MTDFGISVALLTPFDAGGRIDAQRLSAHARDLIARGAASVTLFGTTGEGASIGTQERKTGIEALTSGAVPPERVVLGICASAVADAASQVLQGFAYGIREFLLPPPFYYSSVSDDGLFAWHAEVIRQTPAEAKFILYNIPQVTGVAISADLVSRLGAAFPNRIRAIKESSGVWANASALLKAGKVPVLVGDERLLHRAVRVGCAGSITGMANLFPERLCRIFATAEVDSALSDMVDKIVAGPVTPGLKVLIAHAENDPDWERVRPPFTPLDSTARSTLLRACEAELAGV